MKVHQHIGFTPRLHPLSAGVAGSCSLDLALSSLAALFTPLLEQGSCYGKLVAVAQIDLQAAISLHKHDMKPEAKHVSATRSKRTREVSTPCIERLWSTTAEMARKALLACASV